MNIEQVCRGFRALLVERGEVAHPDAELLMLADAFDDAGEPLTARYLRERVASLIWYPEREDCPLGLTTRRNAPELNEFLKSDTDDLGPFPVLRKYIEP